MNIFNKLASFFKSPSLDEDSNQDTSSALSIKVSHQLKDFLDNEVLDGLDVSSDAFGLHLKRY